MAVNVDKDFYKILGVSKDADAAAIKKAYRKLAKDLHPDKNPGDKKVEERFKEVSEANEVLSDPKRRAEYDEMRTYMANGGGARGPRMGQPGGFADMFGQGGTEFGDLGDLLGGIFGRGRGRGPRRGNDVETSLTISFADSLRGATKSLRLTIESACNSCQGSGVIGQGPCATCQGVGLVRTPQNIQARIPAGVKNGAKIRLAGRGAAGFAGGPSGDLLIEVNVTKHPIFDRDRNNLTISVPIRFDEAVLGADIKVPVFDGEPVTIRIPAGTKNGAKFRARGKGVSRPGHESGDLIVTVEIAVPKDLTEQATEALANFVAQTSDFDPRANLITKAQMFSQAGE